MKLLKVNLEEEDFDNLLFFLKNARLDSSITDSESIYDSVEAACIEIEEDLLWHTKTSY